MMCIICGQRIKKELPVPILEIRFAPVVPYVAEITPATKGETRLQDRLCCQACYRNILLNDFASIQEVGQLHADES
jgi:hypothetical protein